MYAQPKTILVGGATGQQGSAAARHLLQSGFAVRALTRDASQPAAKALAERGAELFEGNYLDRESLDRALDGAWGAFSVQNTWTDGVEGELAQGKSFADAAKAAGVGQFVYSSVGSADQETGIPHFDSKWEIEQHIRDIGLPATVLRPVYFMENWAQYAGEPISQGQLPQPLSPDTRLQQVAVDDIGAFAALAFSAPDQWIGQAIELAGDEPTMEQSAKILGRAHGHEVQYVQVPWEAFEEQAGPEMTTMYRWFEEQGYRADIPKLKQLRPGLLDLGAFLAR